ncbi:hypothetical protein AB0H42_35165 [Nocardia sp. NPDC050799]|uniref:hypothetical protein n=1 Tax=Nocardia sp. NPDC050799 TaxID=3154842 RepID=UPI0033C79F05
MLPWEIHWRRLASSCHVKTFEGAMEKSPREVIKQIAEDAVDAARQAAGKLSGDIEEGQQPRQ